MGRLVEGGGQGVERGGMSNWVGEGMDAEGKSRGWRQ